jgi:hypothetical protein
MDDVGVNIALDRRLAMWTLRVSTYAPTFSKDGMFLP